MLQAESQPPQLAEVPWSLLAPLPDPVGFASPFAGLVGDNLVVAGGANFPNGRPWDGAKKRWHDSIYVLSHPNDPWQFAGQLPAAVAYGVSIQLPDGLLCVGGSDESGHRTSVWVIRLANQRWVTEKWPDLPVPIANACGALLGHVAYVVGGQTAADQRPNNRIFALDMRVPAQDRKWRELEPVPARPRMLSTAGVLGSALYILGGVDLIKNGTEAWRREYLNEVWRYSPAEGWVRRANLPQPTGAAPSPAGVGGGRLYLLGGDNGTLASQAMELKDRHPGFSRSIAVYDAATDTWSEGGHLPLNPGPDPETKPEAGVWPPVTTSLVTWKNRWIVPSGEIRPGVRTRNVISLPILANGSEVIP